MITLHLCGRELSCLEFHVGIYDESTSKCTSVRKVYCFICASRVCRNDEEESCVIRNVIDRLIRGRFIILQPLIRLF